MLSYFDDTLAISATEAAYTGLVRTFGRRNPRTYNVNVGGWSVERDYEPWLLHSFQAWIVDSTGLLKPGQIVLCMAMDKSALGFQELMRGLQGYGCRVTFQPQRPVRCDYGVAYAVPSCANVLADGDFIQSRIVYEVLR